MQNNVFFHCNSPYAGAKTVVTVNRQSYTIPRNQNPLVLTFPVGVNVPVRIAGIKSFWNGVGGNKTYARDIFVPNEGAIIDVTVTIGKAVVSIDIRERSTGAVSGPMPNAGAQQQMMMQQQQQMTMQQQQLIQQQQQQMQEMQRQMAEMQKQLQQTQSGQNIPPQQ